MEAYLDIMSERAAGISKDGMVYALDDSIDVDKVAHRAGRRQHSFTKFFSIALVVFVITGGIASFLLLPDG